VVIVLVWRWSPLNNTQYKRPILSFSYHIPPCIQILSNVSSSHSISIANRTTLHTQLRFARTSNLCTRMSQNFWNHQPSPILPSQTTKPPQTPLNLPHFSFHLSSYLTNITPNLIPPGLRVPRPLFFRPHKAITHNSETQRKRLIVALVNLRKVIL
jgi:hypothetical protein